MRYGLPNLLRKLSSAGIGCSCAMSGRVMKASIAVMTAKRKQDTAAPKSESARWRMYTSECPKSNTRSRRSVSCICAQFDLYRQVGQHPATALAPPLGRKTPKPLNWHHRRSRRGSGRIDALASIDSEFSTSYVVHALVI